MRRCVLGAGQPGKGSFAIRSASFMTASASCFGKSRANIANGSQLRSSGPDAVCLAPGQTIFSSSPAPMPRTMAAPRAAIRRSTRSRKSELGIGARLSFVSSSRAAVIRARMSERRCHLRALVGCHSKIGGGPGHARESGFHRRRTALSRRRRFRARFARRLQSIQSSAAV